MDCTIYQRLDETVTCRGWVLMSYPAMITVPSVMEISPVNILNVVVFPAPESKVQSRSHMSMDQCRSSTIHGRP